MNFYSPIYVHISSEDRYQLDPNLNSRVFADYARGVKGFMLQDTIKKNMVISRDVLFYE